MNWKDYLLVFLTAAVAILYVEIRTTGGELFRRDVETAYRQLANRLTVLELATKTPRPTQSQ